MSPVQCQWRRKVASLILLVIVCTQTSLIEARGKRVATPDPPPPDQTDEIHSNEPAAAAPPQLHLSPLAEDMLSNLTGSEEPSRFRENDVTPSYQTLAGLVLSGLVDPTFTEETGHFNRERIPERVVHAKGEAAFGVFEVTSLEITKYSKASLFSALGKRTPLVTRFSNVAGESGYPDTVRDVRGFAVKFYTDQGNWDLVGNNLPVFFISDPINFAPFIHSQKRNPETHLRDANAFWDFVGLLPESLHTMLMLFSERGIPANARQMNGFGVNTFKLVNARNEPFYAKFHWVCDQGVRNLGQQAANRLAGQDPDYFLRDLRVNIERGSYPSWTLKFQVMTMDQALETKFNPFDVTKTWPHAQFPLIEVGRMTLNRNADNYFAQVEQLAFSPEIMVPGIEPSPDKMLLGRMMSYPDAQRYRLGANYAEIPVNRYTRLSATPTHCDAITYTNNRFCGKQNYLPMRYDGQLLDHERHFNSSAHFDFNEDNSFNQPRVFYQRVLKEASKQTLAMNIAEHMSQVTRPEVVARVLDHFGNVDQRLRRDVERYLRRGPRS